MKKQFFLIAILTLLVLPVIGQAKVVTKKVKSASVSLINSWQVGSSSGIFTDFSQKELDELKSNGITYIELGLGALRNKSQAESEAWINDLKEKTFKAGIEVWSIHLPFSRVQDISSTNDTDRINMIRECERIMALCYPLKPHKYVIHPSSEPIVDADRPVRIKNCIASLKILTTEVKKYKAQLALEDLPRTCLGNTSGELLEIVNSVGDGLGICFDSNHLLKEKPEEFVSKAGSLIKTVHISDYDGIDERHWLPGEGIVNWTNVISGLVKSGYKGPFMFETSRKKSVLPAANDPADKVTSKDLADCFLKLKTDYLRSLE